MRIIKCGVQVQKRVRYSHMNKDLIQMITLILRDYYKIDYTKRNDIHKNTNIIFLYTNLCVNIYNIISPNSQNSSEHTAKLNFVEYKG